MIARSLACLVGCLAPIAGFADDPPTEAPVTPEPPPPPPPTAANPVEPDPHRVGDACSFTTAMFARRVLSEGETWTFTGTLAPTDVALPTHVAAPFRVGPDGEVFVVANEVLGAAVERALTDERITLEGRRLDVENTSYFVPTSFTPASYTAGGH